MVFVKSVLVGLFSLVMAAVMGLMIWAVYLSLRFPSLRDSNVTVGFDLVSMFMSFPLLWVVSVAAFGLGFGWEYRRVRRRRAK